MPANVQTSDINGMKRDMGSPVSTRSSFSVVITRAKTWGYGQDGDFAIYQGVSLLFGDQTGQCIGCLLIYASAADNLKYKLRQSDSPMRQLPSVLGHGKDASKHLMNRPDREVGSVQIWAHKLLEVMHECQK